ncbi:hypothetical protein FIBSPDRAFT_106500 [Athelia psychrophila]|uniref:Uncharacterized protein n=1 Tax=Athelia psychrophila TaxID=1759441 RepID=A0A166D8U6_9AGAM|nr:hypothetical protein FIBSPDRAFT_106500 [Fibularhizoctonia sp. CBS 109695]
MLFSAINLLLAIAARTDARASYAAAVADLLRLHLTGPAARDRGGARGVLGAGLKVAKLECGHAGEGGGRRGESRGGERVQDVGVGNRGALFLCPALALTFGFGWNRVPDANTDDFFSLVLLVILIIKKRSDHPPTTHIAVPASN